MDILKGVNEMINYELFEGHKPGPWHVVTRIVSEHFLKSRTIESPHGTITTILPSGYDTAQEMMGTSNLIAAAPELLAENKRLRELLIKTQSLGFPHVPAWFAEAVEAILEPDPPELNEEHSVYRAT